MKKIIKNNIKVIIAFILGMLMSGITVYGVTLNFASADVEHTKSDGSKTTVSAAINDLYGKSITPTKVTGNAYTGTSGYLNGNSSLTASTQLTLVNYKSGGQYRFNLGSKEQVTLPSGFYDLPINISNGAKSGSTALSDYTDQTLSTPMINDHNRGTFVLTATNLTRIDAIVYVRGFTGDDWAGGGSVSFSGNKVTVYDYGSGENGNNGNHVDTVTVRQYHAFD